MAAKPLDPTMPQLLALIAKQRAAVDACLDDESLANVRRATAADRALEALRPTDPIVLASWLRWRATPIGGAGEEEWPHLLHIADQLEALAECAARLRSVLDRYPKGAGIMIDRDYLDEIAAPLTTGLRHPHAA